MLISLGGAWEAIRSNAPSFSELKLDESPRAVRLNSHP